MIFSVRSFRRGNGAYLANNSVEKWPHVKATTLAKEFSKKPHQKVQAGFLKTLPFLFLCGLCELCVRLNCIAPA